MWGKNLLISIAAKIAPAMLIGENEEDVEGARGVGGVGSGRSHFFLVLRCYVFRLLAMSRAG